MSHQGKSRLFLHLVLPYLLFSDHHLHILVLIKILIAIDLRVCLHVPTRLAYSSCLSPAGLAWNVHFNAVYQSLFISNTSNTIYMSWSLSIFINYFPKKCYVVILFVNLLIITHPWISKMQYIPYLEYPNCLHTTLASIESQWLLHTVPHIPFRHTSTTPQCSWILPCRRTWPLLWQNTGLEKNCTIILRTRSLQLATALFHKLTASYTNIIVVRAPW